MDNFVFLERYVYPPECLRMISWSKENFGYNPDKQISSICAAFKFRNIEDAMAFKLRWL